MNDKFDVAVIGAGRGGVPAAHMAANLGAKVLLVDRRRQRRAYVHPPCHV